MRKGVHFKRSVHVVETEASCFLTGTKPPRVRKTPLGTVIRGAGQFVGVRGQATGTGGRVSGAQTGKEPPTFSSLHLRLHTGTGDLVYATEYMGW